jgi:phytoene synthase
VAPETAPPALAIPAHLTAAYARCREIHRKYDTAFYLGCKMLPPAKRPHVDALYAHARMLDQIVDGHGAEPHDAAGRLDGRLDAFEKALAADGAGSGRDPDPVLAAAAHTARLFEIPVEYFRTFGDAMRSDLTVRAYATFEDLRVYMHGAAALLGLQIVPVLGPVRPEASEEAVNIGYALQVTNILRDIEEDLDRGRVYLPREDLDRFGVSDADLRRRRMTGSLRELIRFEADRARGYYSRGLDAVGMLHPSSRECVITALTLYSGILDSLAAADYQVFGVRHSFSKGKALRVAAPAYPRARRSWRRLES